MSVLNSPFYENKFPGIPRPPWQPYQSAAIDLRHLLILRGLLSYGLCRNTLEIGCFEGYSTMAFLDAQEVGEVETLTVCDIAYPPTLQAYFPTLVLPGQPEPPVDQARRVFRQMDSRVYLAGLDRGDHDFIFVDGCHDKEVVLAETEQFKRLRPMALLSHDTNSEVCRYSGCDGPPYLKATMQTLPGYFCLEDNRLRHGEDTARGFFFATTDLEMFRFAQQIFLKYC